MDNENRKSVQFCRSNFGIIADIRDTGEVFAVVLTVKEKYRHRTATQNWIFPGGSQNPGESDKQTLVRELKEEISCEQKDLGIHYEDIHIILNLKKPADSGGLMTQNFWYIPASKVTDLRGEEQPQLREPDGALLGCPEMQSVDVIFRRQNMKLAHLAAIFIFMGKLMNKELSKKCFNVSPEVSALIRERYYNIVAPYLRKTHFFLERVRQSRSKENYARVLYSYFKVLDGLRQSERRGAKTVCRKENVSSVQEEDTGK